MRIQCIKFIIALVLMLSLHANADWKANLRKGLLGTASIKVVDEDGIPVEGAIVSMHFGIMNGKGNTFEGTTDNSGLVQFTGKSSDNCQVIARKQGYFSSWREFVFFPPHDENFPSELERLAKTGHWESSPKNCTIVLQREYTPATVKEQCLEFLFGDICQTNVPMDFITGNEPQKARGEIFLSIREVPDCGNNAFEKSSHGIFIESSGVLPSFLPRTRRKNSDYPFDTIARESGYTNSVPLYAVDAGTSRAAAIYNANESYIVCRRQNADGKNSYVVISFIDMTMRKSGQFKLYFSYVCIPDEAGNVLQFKIIGRESPRTIIIPKAEAESAK